MAEPGLIAGAAPREREAYLTELNAAADEAEHAAGGLRRRDLLIAGRRITILAAGDELLAALTDAFAHALVEPDPAAAAELTIRAWDRASTGVTLPPPAWGSDDFRGAGGVRAFSTDGLHVLFQEFSNTVSVLDPGAGEGMFWVADAAGLPFYERAAPLCKLLHLWLAGRGMQLAHAAAVAGPSGCALIAGPAGAGKSTAALSCLGHPGLGHLADDYCIVEPSSGGPEDSGESGSEVRVHPLFSSVKATDDTVARLRVDPAAIVNPVRLPTDKALIFLGRSCPGDLAAAAPLRAIVVPEITGAPQSRLVPADGGLALAALAPSTMLQLPGTGAATMRALAAAARSVPTYRLAAGTDPAGIPASLAELLA